MGTNRSGKNRYARIRRAKKNMERGAGTGKAGEEASSGEKHSSKPVAHQRRALAEPVAHGRRRRQRRSEPLVKRAPAAASGTRRQAQPDLRRFGGDLGDRRFFFGRFFGDFLEDLQEHVVGRDAFGLGLEVEDHAVPQRRQVDAADVLEADVVAAFEQGPHLGGQGQRLRAAGAGAPAQILVGDRQRRAAPRDAWPASAARCSPARAGRGSLRGSASAT